MEYRSALALSVLLALVSAVAYAVGAIVQERVATTDADHPDAPVRRPAWWTAMTLNGTGALLHVGALVYGPLSVVQPLGALTIVFAPPIAAVFVGRRAGQAARRGAVMATVGLAGLLSLTGSAEARSPADGERWAVAGASVAAVPSVVVFATAGVLLSQASYRGAGLTAPLATVTVVNPVVASVVGLTLFGGSFRYGTPGALLALGAGLLAVAGLILLTTDRAARERSRGG